MAATSFAGVKFDLSLYFLQCFVTNFACKFSELMHVFQGRQSGRPSIKSGTWNILEDPETFRNIPEHSRTSRNISQHPKTLRNRSQNILEHPESDVGFFVWALYELPRMFIDHCYCIFCQQGAVDLRSFFSIFRFAIQKIYRQSILHDNIL